MVTRAAGARRKLSRERGAAVFIVVMVLTLLTAIGIFAVRSASLADVAAGFDREGAQAALVAQYGVNASAALIGTGISETIIKKMAITPTDDPYVMPFCEANALPPLSTPPSPTPPGWPNKVPCFRIAQSDLDTSFALSSNESTFAPSNTASPVAGRTSSLNVNETTDARFVVELTEAVPTGVPLPGSDLKTRTQYRITLTSMAQVRPFLACSSGAATPTAAQTAMRTVITAAGPPPSP